MVLTPGSPNPIMRYFWRAANLAKHSDHSLHKMGAVLVRNGNVIGGGWNQNKTHPRSKNRYRTIHAELAALIYVGRVEGYLGADMYVVRITRGDSMATSKPCRDCMVLIKEAGIKSVTYIDDKGEIVNERL